MKKNLFNAKCFSIAFLTLIILSCHTNANSQNTAVPQTENGKDEAPLQAYTAPVSGQTQTTETAHITNMTLIPSVEPELLRNVMPNSWHKLLRLTETEEQAFIRENAEVLLEIERPIRNRNIHRYYSIYRQYVGIDTFYRILLTADNNPDFMSRAISFSQYLVYQNTLLHRPAGYNWKLATQFGYAGHFESIDIICGAERAKGVLLTRVTVNGMDNDNPFDWSGVPRINGQPSGFTESNYYLLDNFFSGSDSLIDITASNCLIDPDVPLRYSLQNAFDGDPSTSYVENTRDNLIYIDLVYANYEKITRIAVINGYAQNLSLYSRNNRIKTIGIESLEWNDDHSYLIFVKKDEFLLRDDHFTYQFFNVSFPSKINVLDIYRGEVYNNTCIAELNFLTDNGWLFGDINEQ